jgi:putative ABC transport system ATP-binding protein
MSLIEMKEVSKYYESAGERVAALSDLYLNIDAGEFIAVMGPSGSGKSTLLNILGGLSHPTVGELWVDEINIYKLKGEKLADYRREYIGFVFQSFQLIPYLTVLENVLLPLAIVRRVDGSRHQQGDSGDWVQGCRLPDIDQTPFGTEPMEDLGDQAMRKEVMNLHSTIMQSTMPPQAFIHNRNGGKKALARQVLEKVGLAEKGRRLPNQLSGGEQERVAIARALVNNPPIILADEPTGNLDSTKGKEIMGLLNELNSEGQTIIMVTHNPENARYAHRIIQLKDGRVGA